MRKLLPAALLGFVCIAGVAATTPWVKPAISMSIAAQVMPDEAVLNSRIITIAWEMYARRFSTVREAYDYLTKDGATGTWSRTPDNKGWILTISGVQLETGKPMSLVLRFDYRAYGPEDYRKVSHLVGIAFDGAYFSPDEITEYAVWLEDQIKNRALFGF